MNLISLQSVRAGHYLSLVIGLILLGLGQVPVQAGMLSVSFAKVPSGSDVNLTSIGSLDWIHWGLYTETSLNRKAGVTPLIGNFTLLDASEGFAYLYQYDDHFNGFSWSDGDPVSEVSYTTTGVWVYGVPARGSGFQFNVPADSQAKILKVYVGAYAAKGKFEATLSDGSASSFTSGANNSMSNQRNGEGGVYTLTYAANGPGETLTIRYTLDLTFAGDGNVTMQAAALATPDGNNPPIISLVHPRPNDNFAASASVLLEASATDLDGSVTKVEFLVNGNKLGEVTQSPFAVEWNEAQPGRYIITASAWDDGGAISMAKPVEVFVFGSGGSLVSSVALPPASVNLSVEGETDWIHWGHDPTNVVNRKAGTVPQISPLQTLGTNELMGYEDNYTGFSWDDGAPITSAVGVSHGVYLTGLTNGFQLMAPADNTPRRFKLYVGLYGARSSMQAYLTDFSAMAYADQSLTNMFGNSYAEYTFDYTAATSGQSLIVRYRTEELYDFSFGNVTLQAATLSGGDAPSNAPPTVLIQQPSEGALYDAPAAVLLVADAQDVDGTIQRLEFYQGNVKLADVSSAPYQYEWTNVMAGAYVITARAIDNGGLMATSAPVNIQVRAPAEPVSLSNVLWDGSELRFSFPTVPDRIYTVYFSESLTSTLWEPVMVLPGTGESVTVTNAQGSNLEGYYRVRTD